MDGWMVANGAQCRQGHRRAPKVGRDRVQGPPRLRRRLHEHPAERRRGVEIGRASCRERVERWEIAEAEDGIRDRNVTGVQTCALPISSGDLRTENKYLVNGWMDGWWLTVRSVDKDIVVRLKWGETEYKGRLVSVDGYMNIQLSGAEEW